eukprot:6958444-Pyramimonas_sp.AAC.1
MKGWIHTGRGGFTHVGVDSRMWGWIHACWGGFTTGRGGFTRVGWEITDRSLVRPAAITKHPG